MDVQITVNLKPETCCACGIPFAIPDYLMDRLRREGGTFYCPNGHGQHYTENEVDRLVRERDDYKRMYQHERGAHSSTKNSLRATKAAHTRTKNRISHGVCPCCNRHFDNLHRHMETKHPEYGAAESGERGE